MATAALPANRPGGGGFIAELAKALFGPGNGFHGAAVNRLLDFAFGSALGISHFGDVIASQLKDFGADVGAGAATGAKLGIYFRDFHGSSLEGKKI
jgi:hypothetical protein